MPDNKEKEAQELYVEFKMLDEQIKQLQKHLELITNQLVELTVSNNSLDELKKISSEKNIFVPVSSGIFAKAVINDTSQLFVNIGANVIVQKNLDSTKKLIQNQIEEIKNIQKKILEDLEKMTNRAMHLERQLQGIMASSQ